MFWNQGSLLCSTASQWSLTWTRSGTCTFYLTEQVGWRSGKRSRPAFGWSPARNFTRAMVMLIEVFRCIFFQSLQTGIRYRLGQGQPFPSLHIDAIGLQPGIHQTPYVSKIRFKSILTLTARGHPNVPPGFPAKRLYVSTTHLCQACYMHGPSHRRWFVNPDYLVHKQFTPYFQYSVL